MISAQNEIKLNAFSAENNNETDTQKFNWDLLFPDQENVLEFDSVVIGNIIFSNRVVVANDRIENIWAPKVYHSLPIGTAKSVDVSDRLAQLKTDAKEEDVFVSEKSKSALKSFLEEARAQAIPKITLNENGNFRAVWEGRGSDQVGIEFESRSRLNYVILVGPKNDRCDQHYGSCSAKTLFGILTSLKVDRLI